MQNGTVLLFDVMDTLVYNPINSEVPAFFELSRTALRDQTDLAVWEQFELGQIGEAEYFRRYFHDGRTVDGSKFQRMMHTAYRWIDGVEGILDRLSQAGIEIHAFSNYPIWYRTIESKLQLSRYLQWTFVSCVTGIRKPAAAAFQGPAHRLNRPSESFLLVDDDAGNCGAATANGMPAIQFVGATDLLSQLRRCGLIQ